MVRRSGGGVVRRSGWRCGKEECEGGVGERCGKE